MNPFEKIIGYESVRKELEKTADALKNPQIYAKLGTCAPRGLLLYGKPGVGKTLMASCLIQASGRKVFACRKDKPDRNFASYIREVFKQAEYEAPSIVFLDDLDKFSNDDEERKNTEEYVTVQTCIDIVKTSDVFVIATANDIDLLPVSLLRTGRFDRVIHIDVPDKKDAVDIIRHYLRNKPCEADMDYENLGGIMALHSCSDLETAVNKAGLLAGYERCDKISLRHLILGCIYISCEIAPESIISGADGKEVEYAAYHEAGHVVVSEILFPGSVSASCVFKEDDGYVSGITKYNFEKMLSVDGVFGKITRTMAGCAAVKYKFGSVDLGSSRDINDARWEMSMLIEHSSAFGEFPRQNNCEYSQNILSGMEQIAAVKIEECSKRAEKIIFENRELFEAVAKELLSKGLLIAEDIRRIKRTVLEHETFLSHRAV